MAAAGAKGRTYKQLGRAPELWATKKEPSYRLMSANRLWVHLGFPLQEPYMEASEKSFGVRPWMVDFSKAPDFLRDRVNGWVSEKTSSKIKSIITENSVDEKMRMILTSAIYFKGDWVYPFDKNETQEGKFTTESDGKIKVPFLFKKGSFNYTKNHDHQIIELPYLDGEIALVIILPNNEDGLEHLERSLKPENVEKWLGDLAVKEMNLYLPKFEFDSNLDLKEPLSQMGISDAFNPEAADFSGMNGTKDLFLSSFVHQTTIGLSEEGTEATSASSSGGSRSPASSGTTPNVSLSFKADHPFVFLIRHRGSNSILFLGHVVKPMLSKFVD